MPKIVEYRGVRKLMAAEILADDNETGAGTHGYKTGTPFEIAGVANITKTREESSESHYYDNIPAIIITAEGPDTVTIDTSAIPLSVVANLTGQEYISAKFVFVEKARTPKYFALLYACEDTDGKEIFVVRYKGTFAVPDQTNATIDDGTTANGQQLVFTGISTTHKFDEVPDSSGTGTAPARALNFEATDHASICTESQFFSVVHTPDMIVSGQHTQQNILPTPDDDVTFTVTYDGNGAASGTAPTDTNSPYQANSTVTVLGNTGDLVKGGYLFGGWNTKADGTGTTYQPDATFTIQTNTTLYAIWTEDEQH